MTDQWRNARHVVYRLHAHIVLVPKYRRKVMTKRVTDELETAFVEVCGHFGATLDAFETYKDHAHLLVSYPPKVALSHLVMSLKTNSSRRSAPKGGRKSHEHFGVSISGPRLMQSCLVVALPSTS